MLKYLSNELTTKTEKRGCGEYSLRLMFVRGAQISWQCSKLCGIFQPILSLLSMFMTIKMFEFQLRNAFFRFKTLKTLFYPILSPWGFSL